MLKFLIDENVGKSVVDFLKKEGFDCMVATANELASREDVFLLEYAFREGRIVITNDKDFGFLVFRQKLPSHGIILFRFINESPSLKISALEYLLSLEEGRLMNHFIVISEDKIRFRPIREKEDRR